MGKYLNEEIKVQKEKEKLTEQENKELRENQELMQKALDDLILNSMGGDL